MTDPEIRRRDLVPILDHPRSRSGLDLAHLPPNDPAVYRMLQEADTIGIFQVESRAQMATLPRLRPETFYDIVVEVAIIRPGPIVGQMVHPYLKRRQGQEPVAIRIRRWSRSSRARSACRCSRSSCCGWRWWRRDSAAARPRSCAARSASSDPRSACSRSKGKLRAGMARQGITGDAAEEIIRSITSFALYGFPESHAASFALLVYASAYLKAHYPAAFYAAHAQQPADGVLPPVDAGEGCAAPRRPLRADRRAGLGLALPRRARRPRAARPDVRERPAAGSRQGD